MLSTILIIVLILLLIGALPTWPYSSGWGYYPGGGLGLVLIIVIVLALSGRIRSSDSVIASQRARAKSRSPMQAPRRSNPGLPRCMDCFAYARNDD